MIVRIAAFVSLSWLLACSSAACQTSLDRSQVAAAEEKVRAEIKMASDNGVGVRPYQAGLDAIDRDLQGGLPLDGIMRRLNYLEKTLNEQLSFKASHPHALHTQVRSNNSAPTDASTPSTADEADAKFNMDTFVYTVKGAFGVGDVSPEILDLVKSTIRTMPEKSLALLQSRGAHVCVTPRMADKFPGFRNTHPRGWGDDATGKNVDGLFDGKECIVCEKVSSRADDTVYIKSTRTVPLLRHELGHAFDHYWGDISGTEEFKHTYLLEVARMDPADRDGRLAYFAQKSEGGPQESFAELFAIIAGGGDSKETDAAMSRTFPECIKLIKKKLGF